MASSALVLIKLKIAHWHHADIVTQIGRENTVELDINLCSSAK
jgi:hypothetical protein